MTRARCIMVVAALLALGIACGDPKTPPNSPIPEIDKPEDPKSPPSPKLPFLGGDAG